MEARHLLTSGWQNPLLPEDVSGDASPTVSALDALLVINELNTPQQSDAEGRLPELTALVGPPPYFDVSGDGVVSSFDALLVINYLNEPTAGADANLPEDLGSAALLSINNSGFDPLAERLVNASTSRVQETPDVAVVPGGSIVVWASCQQDGSDWGVFGQRLDASGQRVGAEFRVSQTSAHSQQAPRVSAFADGRFVVVWESQNQAGDPSWGVYGRLFNADGSPAGDEFRVNETVTGTQRAPSVAVLNDGTFAVSWEGRGQVTRTLKDDYEIFVRRFSAIGAPLSAQQRVNAASKGTQQSPSLAALPGGGLVVAWTGSGTGDAAGVYLRRLDANLTPLGVETLVNATLTRGEQRHAKVAVSASGQIVVVWASNDARTGWNVRGQRFNPDGTFQGAAFQVNSYSIGDQCHPTVEFLGDGRFVVAWQGKGAADPSGVSYREFDAAGVPLDVQHLANHTTADCQLNPAIGGGTSSFVIVWDGNGPGDRQGIFVRGGASSGPSPNRPPVNSVPGAQSVNEDAVLVLSLATSNRITIADPDVGGELLQVTLAANLGALTLTNVSGLSFSQGTGTNDSTMTFTGTLADINARLDTLRFAPPADYFGAATITITTDDLGNQGVGGPRTDVDTIPVTVQSVNDAPSFLAGDDIAVNEADGAQSIADWATGITAGPANESSQQLTFLVTTDNDSLFAVLPAISAAGTLSFNPAAGISGTATISVRLRDDGGTLRGGQNTSDTQTFTITISSDAPIDGSPFTLAEESLYEAKVERSFVVPNVPSILQIFYDAPQFDVTAQDRVRDAFEVALVDTDGQPLVHTIATSRDAFFNQSEGRAPRAGINAQLATGLVRLDLSHLDPGAAATLIVRLVNDDGDTTTSVHITSLNIIPGTLNTPIGLAGAAAPTATGLSPEELARRQDVTSDLRVVFETTSLNAGAGTLFSDVAFENIGNATLPRPLIAVVDQLSDPTVEVREPDGYTPEGLPYFDYSDAIPGDALEPGESTTVRSLAFSNPSGIPFTFHVSLYTLTNSEPTLADVPALNALVGQLLEYPLDGADADGDGLTYRLLNGPPEASIDEHGRLHWTPTLEDVGTHTFRVQITDGAGGSAEQSFVVEVRNDIPNRPPVITSAPVLDAEVAFSFDITDYDVGRGPVGVVVGDFTGAGRSILTANELNQSVSLVDLASSSNQPSTTILGEPPPRADQLFEQGYNLDVGFRYNRSQSVQGLSSADFDGDGLADVAVTIHSDRGFSNQEAVMVLLGLGDGTFQSPRTVYEAVVSFNTNTLTANLARDFDGDGNIDLAVAETGDRNVMVFLGHGDGTFDAPLRSPTVRRPSHLHAADLDADGDLDLAVGSEDGNGWIAEVLLNQGNGAFGASTVFNTFPGSYLPDIQLADVDGVFGPDLIIGNWSNGRAEIRLNDGTGQFGAPLLLQLASGASAITPGDFNGDGKLDLHIGQTFGEAFTYLGNGDGTFVAPTEPSPFTARLGFQPNHAYADGGNSAVDINGDGHLDVYYSSRGNNVLVVGFGRGDGTFDYEFMFAQPAPDDPTRAPDGSGFSSPLLLDANHDGVLDMATASFNIDGGRPGKLSVILGDTPGSFRTPKIVTTPNVGAIQADTLADVNNDGAPDILQIGPPMATALNNADGTFADSQRAVGSFSGPGEFFGNQVITADMDGDGNLDAFFTGTGGVQGGPSARLIVSLGLGNGDYELPTIFGTGAYSIGMADLNGDDRPDPIVVNAGGIGKRIELWINNGTGDGFALLPDANNRLSYPTTGDGFNFTVSGFATADFDGDGIVDLVAHSTAGENNTPPEQFMFFKGRSSTNPTDASDLFEAPVITTPSFRPIRRMVSADLDHDGNQDLLALRDIGGFYVLMGHGDGTFATPVFYGGGLDSMAVADFDGDGNLDIGLTNSFYAPTFRRGRGDGTFGREEFYASFQLSSNYNVAAADVDGDRADDFLFASGNDAGAYRGNAVYISRRPGIQEVVAGDLNGDGREDAVAVDYGLGHLTPLLGDGAGNFTRQFDLVVGRGPVAATIADLNGDQNSDIVSVNRAANSISVLVNAGNGQFTRTDLATGQRPAAIVVGDLSGDGLPDLAVANSDETSISYFKNLGSGAFAPAVSLAIGIHPDQIAADDVDDDGRLDLVVGSSTEQALAVVRQTSTDVFVPLPAIPTNASLAGLGLGDLNGDGRPDLVATNPDERRVSLYLGLGGGQFARPQPIAFDHEPTDVTLADTNGDGQLDIVTANRDSDTATVIVSRFLPDNTYHYDVTAADADGDALAFELATAPDGMSIDAAGRITWSATPDQVGTHPVTVVVRDGRGGTATQTYEVEVRAASNGAPVFVTLPVTNTLSTTNYEAAARAADPDGDSVRYELANGPDGLLVDANTGDLSWGESIGRGVTLNGRDDMVIVGSSPSLNLGDEFTFAVWVKFNTTPIDLGHNQFLVGSTDQTTLALNGREWNGVNRFEFEVFGRRAISNTVLQAGQWYHVAGTYRFGAATQLYINGALDSGAGVADLQNHPPLPYITIGNTPGDGNRELGLDGSLDEVRIFSTALTAQQIADEFARRGPNAPGLIGDWQFNELDGPVAYDHSGFGNHATLAAPYAGRRQRDTFDDRVSPAGRSGDYPFVLRAVDGRGGSSEWASILHVAADAPASIAGRVFDDQNDDEQGTGEPGLANWIVYLDVDGNGTRESFEPFTQTDALGHFEFTQLAAGDYRVVVEGRSGFRITTPTDGVANVTVAAGEQQTNVDAGVTDLNVSAAARGPSFTSAAPLNGVVGERYIYQPVVRNPDGRPLEFSVLVAPEGFAMQAQTGGIAWTPTLAQSGAHRVIVRVRDDRGLVAVQDFTLQIAAAPSAPVISTRPVLVAYPDQPYRYQARAQDADGGPLEFSLDGSPNGMTVDPQTGRVEWTPTAAQLGANTVSLVVTDSTGRTDRQTFEIQVIAAGPNHVPQITSSPRTDAGLGRLYRYQVETSDRDGDPLDLALDTAPLGMTIDANGLVRWTPEELGDFAVVVRASDGRGGVTTQDFTIRVTSVLTNQAPRFTSAPLNAVAADALFAYDPDVLDPDGDAVQFLLDQGPAGLSIDAATGALRWQTAAETRGDFDVRLRAIDPYGAEATQAFTLAVRSPHAPPAITSTPPTEAAANVDYEYPVLASDPFGRPLTYQLLAFPTGMTIDVATGEIRWKPTLGQVGAASVIVQVTNDAGGAATQEFDIVVTSGARNQPPVISSTPTEQATVGVPYEYEVSATDPEGLTLHYELRSAPAAMQINSSTGRITWTPTAADVGAAVVTVAALDPANAAALQTYVLSVLGANHAPQITSAPANRSFSAGAAFRHTLAATDADLDRLTFDLTQAPSGMTIDAFGRIAWQTSLADLGAHPVTATVSDGRGGLATQSFTVTVVPDTTLPRVTVIPLSNLVYAFNSAVIRVSATDDVRVASLKLTMDGIPVPLDSQGVAVVPFPATSRISTFTATAVDAAGNIATASNAVKFFNSAEESSYPQVAIDSPSDTGVVFGPIDVVGTVADDNLRDWQLLVRREDQTDADFVEIASGTTTVQHGVLGRFDPTLLENDGYILRLVATDQTGFDTFVDTHIGVSGDLKLGNFQLAFADLTIPVSGIPIQVTRTYDTLRADRTGDFGYGWRLDFRNTDLRTGLPKSGLEEFGIYSAFRPGVKVYLTLPGGKREGFTFTPEIRSLLDLTIVTPRFTPDPGVTNSLSVQAGTFLLGEDGAIYSGGGQPYNPAADEFGGGYTLTTKEGVAYSIDGKSGLLRSATDRNGNQLTFSSGGILSEDGVGITFERDAAGRIVTVTDPAGAKLRYAYSPAGDLIRATDRMGQTTQFAYRSTPAHYLDSVTDPLGRTGIRTDYNAEGRLVRLTNVDGKTIETTYDPDNQLVTVTDVLGFDTTYEYDERGNVVSEFDPLGGVTHATYNDLNLPLTQTDPLARTTRYEYDASGNETSRTDPAGNVTRQTYGAFSQLTAIVDPLGNAATNDLDRFGNVVRMTNRLGDSAQVTYDAQGAPSSATRSTGQSAQFDVEGSQLTRVLDAVGTELTFDYNATGHTTSVRSSVTTPTGPSHAELQATYNANDQVVTFVDPLGNVSSFEYDAVRNLTASVDRLGRRTTYAYDLQNRLILTTFADGTQERISYDDAGRKIAVIDPAGHETRYQYDALGRRTAILLPDNTPGNWNDNPRRLIAYDLAGQIVTTTDELGRETHFEYDLAGNRTAVVDALGGRSAATYDANRQPTSITDPVGRTTHLSYNAHGEFLTTTYADGMVELYTYNASGLTLSHTNGAGETTRYEYDALDRLTAVIDPLGNRTTYAYDEFNRLLRTTDALGRITAHEYDLVGRRTADVLPDGARRTYSYNAEGELTTSTDLEGVTIQYQYDLRGRLVREIRPEQTIVYAYTANGLRSQVTDTRGATVYAYDERDRLTSVTEPDGRALHYTYDAVGNVLTMQSPAGTVSYAYDALDRPTTTTGFDGEVTIDAYDAAGSRISRTYPNGAVETRTLDALGRVAVIETTKGAATLERFTYTFDAAGRRATLTDLAGRVTTYAYDDAGRLVGETVVDATHGNHSTTFEYDAVGNRVARHNSVDGTTTYEYDSRDRLTRETTGTHVVQYTYDDNGNLLVRDGGPTDRLENTWDSRGRLTQQRLTNAGGTTVVTFAYDADGLRVSRTSGGNTVRYLLDRNRPFAEVVEESTPTGTLLAKRVFAVGDSSPISQSQSGATALVHSDALGSTMFVTNAAGVVTDQWRYDAFGTVDVHVGSSDLPYLFAGEPRDPLTGLDYLRARYYDPSNGRFLSADTYAGRTPEPLTFHRYVYANDDPVNGRDPSGNQTLVETLKTSAIVGIVSGSVTGAVFAATARGNRAAAFGQGFALGFGVGATLSFGFQYRALVTAVRAEEAAKKLYTTAKIFAATEAELVAAGVKTAAFVTMVADVGFVAAYQIYNSFVYADVDEPAPTPGGNKDIFGNDLDELFEQGKAARHGGLK